MWRPKIAPVHLGVVALLKYASQQVGQQVKGLAGLSQPGTCSMWKRPGKSSISSSQRVRALYIPLQPRDLLVRSRGA